MSLLHDELKSLLKYEPETGLWRWVAKNSKYASRRKIGNLAGNVDSAGYVKIHVLGYIAMAHRLAWYYMTKRWPEGDIDHINFVRHDNRWCNLRELPESKNRARHSHARKARNRHEYEGKLKHPRKEPAGFSTYGTLRAETKIKGAIFTMPRKPPISPEVELKKEAPLTEWTDDALIAENFKIEDLIKAAQAKFNEWAEPHKARLKEIEDTLFARLAERKADSTKTDSGTAYISNIMNAKVESTPTLFDFVAEHWADVGDEVKINIPISVVREHMENHNGMVPPGMSVSHFSRLNIKRS